jgi:hypothetical protein
MKKDASELRGKILDIAIRVRSLGYLIECQKDDGVPPLDQEELIMGVGLLVGDQGRKLLNVWKKLDELSIDEK